MRCFCAQAQKQVDKAKYTWRSLVSLTNIIIMYHLNVPATDNMKWSGHLTLFGSSYTLYFISF